MYTQSPLFVDPNEIYPEPGKLQIKDSMIPSPGTANPQSGGQTTSSDGFRYLDPSQHQLDPRYMDALRGAAFDDPGQSPWLKYQMQQDQIRQASDRDSLQNMGSSNLATQQGQMAMRGGLTSGATERLGYQNMQNMIQGNSELNRSSAAREAGYRQQAEQRQRAILMGMPQAELGYSGYGQDLQGRSNQEYNQAEAARQMAEAIRNSGGGGGGGSGIVPDTFGQSPFEIPGLPKPLNPQYGDLLGPQFNPARYEDGIEQVGSWF